MKVENAECWDCGADLTDALDDDIPDEWWKGDTATFDVRCGCGEVTEVTITRAAPSFEDFAATQRVHDLFLAKLEQAEPGHPWVTRRIISD